VVEVTERVIRDAGGLAEQLRLRGYDAVHLASAILVDDPELVLAAGDQGLLAATRAVGMATADLTARRQ
jgi:predicted nucleic acid-binding protein